MKDPRESFNELTDTPLDFLAFVINRLKVDTLTPELLAGPTFELMKGSCKSLVELKYFLEEVYKATTDQLDWINPEGQQYPHDISIVIQRRVGDLQLGVKSYQKKLNLIKLDTYRSYLNRREAYSAYSNPRGFIHQNKDKKNRFMRIDELYKFSDGTLNDVRTALNDRLKGIRMNSLAQMEDPRELFNELMETPLDFSAFVMNWLKVDTLTPELLTGPTFELVKGSCKSLVELILPGESIWLGFMCSDDDKFTYIKTVLFQMLRIQVHLKNATFFLFKVVDHNLTMKNAYFYVSLRMFTRKHSSFKARLEDRSSSVKSYQKKLNLTKLDTYRPDLKRKGSLFSFTPIPRMHYTEQRQEGQIDAY
ncbi:hypothetical protein Tco_0897185 [Tanacetum coccineum]